MIIPQSCKLTQRKEKKIVSPTRKLSLRRWIQSIVQFSQSLRFSDAKFNRSTWNSWHVSMVSRQIDECRIMISFIFVGTWQKTVALDFVHHMKQTKQINSWCWPVQGWDDSESVWLWCILIIIIYEIWWYCFGL